MKKICTFFLVFIVCICPLYSISESTDPFFPDIYEDVSDFYKKVYYPNRDNTEMSYYWIGFKDAYELFISEEKVGKVNSNAIHAAERLLLGEKIYNETEGRYSKVQKVMNTKGRSGTPLEAYDILFATYRNENGNVTEGYGIYELLRLTKGYNFKLTNEKGGWCIPELYNYQIEGVCAEWGGLNIDIFWATLYALEQYDHQ